MTANFPAYLSITREQLGQGTPVKLRIGGDMAALAEDMARDMCNTLLAADRGQHPLTIIAPVGPVDQYPILAGMINRQRIACQDVMIINMDEYLSDDGQWIDMDHPLSFRGYMNRKFYDLLDPDLAPLTENRVFPDPRDPAGVQRMIDDRGGVEVSYGGIGINAHMAFNEPEESVEIDEFATRPTRVLELSPQTRTINANTIGGEISVIPSCAVTVGMKEILGSRRLHFYCNRPWQSAVVRRVLHGPLTAACPASLLRTHADATLTIADYVAQPPDIRLR